MDPKQKNSFAGKLKSLLDNEDFKNLIMHMKKIMKKHTISNHLKKNYLKLDQKKGKKNYKKILIKNVV